jgi:hypothetical protein
MSGITEAILGGIGSLDKRPNAVANAIDTYQGAPRADYSLANNSKVQAKKISSIGKLLESVGSNTLENYQKIEERSAFDTYVLSSPEEQKEYKKAVKNNRLAPSQSPFFRRKLETLIAKDSVMSYQQQYAVDYQLAIQSNPNLNLTEWNRNHYSSHVKEFGLDNMSTEAQAIFGKGIEPMYISTLAQNMKAKEESIRVVYDTKFSSLVVGALEGDKAPEVIDKLLTEHYPDIGMRTGRGLEIIKSAVSGAILDAAGSEDGTLAHKEAKYLEVLSNVKLAKGVSYGSTGKGKELIAKLEVAADREFARASAAREQVDIRATKEMIKGHESAKDEYVKNGGTIEQFWKTDEGSAQIAWARDIGKYSEDTSKRTHATLLLNQAFIKRDDTDVNSFIQGLEIATTLDSEITEKAIELGGFSGAQLKEIQDRTATIRMGLQGTDLDFIKSTEKSFLKPRVFGYAAGTDPTNPASHDRYPRQAIWNIMKPKYNEQISLIPKGLEISEAVAAVNKINSDYAETLASMLQEYTNKKYENDMSPQDVADRSKILGTKLRDTISVSQYLNGEDYKGALALRADYIRKGTWNSLDAKALVQAKLEKTLIYKFAREVELPVALVLSQMAKFNADPKGWSEEGVIEDPNALAKLKHKEGNVFSTGGN